MLVKKTNDKKLIYELDKQCFNDFYSLELLNSLNDSHFFYLIINNDQIIGFIILNNCDTNEYELIKIGILKEFRNHGYGQLAINELLKTIQWNKVFLEVDEKNLAAVKLYNNLGFNFVNKRKQYYKNGNDALIFVKTK